MKKLFLLLLLLLLPACARAEAQPFAIDRDHIYEPMSRTYEQGYAPTVSDNRLTVVLPLLSDAADARSRPESPVPTRRPLPSGRSRWKSASPARTSPSGAKSGPPI